MIVIAFDFRTTKWEDFFNSSNSSIGDYEEKINISPEADYFFSLRIDIFDDVAEGNEKSGSFTVSGIVEIFYSVCYAISVYEYVYEILYNEE